VKRLRRPRPVLRHLWLVPGLAIAFYANAQAGLHGLGLVPVLAFGIAPHLPAWLGLRLPHGPGQLPAQTVLFFNVLHHPALPLAVLGLAAAGVLPPFWFVGSLAWLSHVVMDWAMGDGLRTADGYLRARSIWNGRPFGLTTNPASATTSGGQA
jgi:hypothetical protein